MQRQLQSFRATFEATLAIFPKCIIVPMRQLVWQGWQVLSTRLETTSLQSTLMYVCAVLS